MSEEEQNLSRRERRAQAKSGGAGSAGDKAEDIKDRNQRLRAEAAAKRRRLRESERASAAREGLDAAERMDDAFSRSADAGARFLRNNFTWLQWIIVGGAAVGMGVLIYKYRLGLQSEKQGAKLASILSAEFGRVTTSDDPPSPSDSRLVDPRAEFESLESRARKALEAWAGFTNAKNDDLKLAAQLGQAGALYDQGKYAEARGAYQKLADDPRTRELVQIRGRALEGVGLSFEAEQKYAEAKQAFEKLGALDAKEFKNLQQLHLARTELLLGNRDKAKELLVALDAKLSEKAGPQGPTDYVGAAARDLLKTVDPSMAQKEQQAISTEQMQELLKQFEAMQRGEQPTPAPGVPPASDPPEAEAADSEPPLVTPPAAPPKVETSPPPAPQAPPAQKPVPVPAPQAPSPGPQAPAPSTAPSTPPAPTAPAPTTPEEAGDSE